MRLKFKDHNGRPAFVDPAEVGAVFDSGDGVTTSISLRGTHVVLRVKGGTEEIEAQLDAHTPKRRGRG